MKTSIFIFIALRIIVLFMVGMMSTFLPEHLREFFGDTKFIPYTTSYGYYVTEDGGLDTDWVWGVRHYWFHYMMVFLFILSLVDTFISIRSKVVSNYPNQF